MRFHSNDPDRLDLIDRRAFLVGGIQGVVFSALVARLGWLQIVEGDKYRTLAENNRINVKIMPPPRGVIVDRFGVPLALNRQDYVLWLVPEQTDDPKESINRLRDFITISDDAMARIEKDMRGQPKFIPVQVRGGLSWDDVARLEVNIADLPGVSIHEVAVRSYPLAEATAHLIGYVGAVSKEDQGADPVLSVPGFRVGKSGLEKIMEDRLRGRAGYGEVEVNVRGREVRQLENRDSVAGDRLALTLDADLQMQVYQRLSAERSASAVVMDVENGAVYAMASYPSFNPNRFTNGIPATDWDELSNDPAHPLNNKCAGGQYPPGSTFKMITALAALEAGVISRHTRTFCPGHFSLGSSTFHCWKKGGHGSVNVVDALAESCDTFFYALAGDLGIDRLAAMARKFGLGAKTGLGLIEEKSGLIPDLAWKKKTLKQPWHPGETVVAVIGQGYVQTTPLQLAMMTARLCTGRAVTPWIMGIGGNEYHGPTGTPASLGIKPENLALVLDGMNQVVNSGRGTAGRSRIADAPYSMAGKTGTSQVRRITAAERAAGVRNESLPWHHRHHALFVGYGPVEKPRYACAVVVEHGVSGSGAAAPIAKDILLAVQKRDPAAQDLKTLLVDMPGGGG